MGLFTRAHRWLTCYRETSERWISLVVEPASYRKSGRLEVQVTDRVMEDLGIGRLADSKKRYWQVVLPLLLLWAVAWCPFVKQIFVGLEGYSDGMRFLLVAVTAVLPIIPVVALVRVLCRFSDTVYESWNREGQDRSDHNKRFGVMVAALETEAGTLSASFPVMVVARLVSHNDERISMLALNALRDMPEVANAVSYNLCSYFDEDRLRDRLQLMAENPSPMVWTTMLHVATGKWSGKWSGKTTVHPNILKGHLVGIAKSGRVDRRMVADDMAAALRNWSDVFVPTAVLSELGMQEELKRYCSDARA